VIDTVPVDGPRSLILIRRDQVEHLLMIGGPTDVVIEPNIVRAVAAAREAPSRAPTAIDTQPRTVPLGDVHTWPPQPEPGSAPPRPMRAAVADEPVQWSVEPELPPPPLQRLARTADPLEVLAADLARSPEPPRLSMPTDLGGPGAFVPREPARQRRAWEPVREREAQLERELMREREPAWMRDPGAQPAPSVPAAEFNANADQNLADMVQRLEAALRRPPRLTMPRSPEP
jgi:hypothetical protein